MKTDQEARASDVNHQCRRMSQQDRVEGNGKEGGDRTPQGAIRPSVVSWVDRHTPQPESDAPEAGAEGKDGRRKSMKQEGRAHKARKSFYWEAGEIPRKGMEDIACQTERNTGMSSRRRVMQGIQRPRRIWNNFKETLGSARANDVKLTRSAKDSAGTEAAPNESSTHNPRSNPCCTRERAFSGGSKAPESVAEERHAATNGERSELIMRWRKDDNSPTWELSI